MSKKYNRTVIAISLWLALLVWGVFGQTLLHDFVNYDDHRYVYTNPVISQGITWRGIGWILTREHTSNWHPLTSFTNLLDVQLYGLNAGGHHATNVILHTAAVLALFLVLRSMTGSLWRSAFVAALFAVHPLRVESVAWIAERKDVLSGLFFFLTLGAYLRYVRRPFSLQRYGAVAGLFALGLLSKSMLVTLPFVLLLLDFWPLGRFQGVEPRKTALRLIAEKIPLLGLSAIFSILYLFIQKEQVNCGEQIPLVWRAINALISYGTYIQQLFFPAQLAPFYPLQPPFSLRDTLLSILLLSTISLGVFVSRKKRPFLVTGWLWYLGMLVPVIGLVQVGIQSHADRYTYLPHLGLLMMLVWLIPTPPPGRRTARIAPAIAAGLLVTTYATAAFLQTRHWKNSRTLWEHALTCTDPNHIALGCLALAKQHQGDLEGALKLLRQSLDLYANDPATHNNIGNILLIQGEAQAALDSFNSALLIEPDAAVSLSNKAKALVELGKSEAALECLEAALRRDPDQPELFDRTGLLLIQLGRTQESIAFFEAAARLRPKWDLPQVHLGGAYILLKRPDLTAEHFRIALELNPNQPAVFNYIGNQLLRQGRHAEAITFYRQALEIQPTLTVARDGLLRAMEKEPPAAQTPHISNSEGAVEAIFIPTP